MKSAPFEYHLPGSAAEAVAMLDELGEDAKVIAAGQSLVPMLALRLTAFEHLVDVGRVTELSGIETDGDTVRIGATTRQSTVEHSAIVAGSVPLLAKATPLIGHSQIRNRGTLGGAIAHADPAAESPTVALTLDAELEALSPRGTRVIAATDFFAGTWTTVLEPDEVLTAVTFPVWRGRTGFAVEEFARRHGDFAIAGATVAIELDADDRFRRCRIGLFGLGSTPLRAVVAENEAEGRTVTDTDPEELGQLAVAQLDSVPSDLQGDAEYRKQVGAAVVARAFRRAVQEASGA